MTTVRPPTLETVIISWIKQYHQEVLPTLEAYREDPTRFSAALVVLERHWVKWVCEQARHWSRERRQRLWTREDQALAAGYPWCAAERWAWTLALAEDTNVDLLSTLSMSTGNALIPLQQGKRPSKR